MKLRTLIFIPLIAAAGSVNATSLCDADCDLNITYPSGGSIIASEQVTITFGNGGFINDGTSTVGKAAGETEVIAAGGSLGFTAGGELDLGDGGNVDYTSITFTGGDITLAAIGGNQRITFDDVSLEGDVTLMIDSDIEVIETGSLTIRGGDVAIEVGDAVTFTQDGVLSVATGNLVWSGGWVTSTNWGTSCDDYDAMAGTITMSSVDVVTTVSTCASLITYTGSLSLGGDVLLVNVEPAVIDSGGLTLVGDFTGSVSIGDITGGSLTMLTNDDFVDLQGLELVAADGTACTIDGDACVSADGARYVFVDGELVVEVSEDSGALDVFYLLSILTVLALRHRRFIIR